MYRTLLKSKIHRAVVTEANVDYVGSITIDAELMKQADILPGELVHVVDVTNGARLETYAIEGPAGSGAIEINGAAARLIFPRDTVIIIAYGLVENEKVHEVVPQIVHVDAANRPIALPHMPKELIPEMRT